MQERRSRSIALWFGAISAVLLAVLGLLVIQHMRRGIERRALESAELVSGVVARSIIDQQFTLTELLSDQLAHSRASGSANAGKRVRAHTRGWCHGLRDRGNDRVRERFLSER